MDQTISLSQSPPATLLFIYRRGIDYYKVLELADDQLWEVPPTLEFDDGEEFTATLSTDQKTAAFTIPAVFFTTIENHDKVVLRQGEQLLACGRFTVAEDLTSFAVSKLPATSDVQVVSSGNEVKVYITDKPNLTFIGDQLALEGEVISPHLTGPQGATGPVGPPGPKGDKGDTGEQGPVGPVGAAGSDGATGPQGASRAQGPTGPVGPKGDPGAQGATGPTGPKGDTGAAAPVDTMLAVVRHGSNASETRPTGFGAVYWIGSVAPSNAVDGDFWREQA